MCAAIRTMYITWLVSITLLYLTRYKSRYIHGTNRSTHFDPSRIRNAHSHIVKNFVFLSLAWRWLFKSKHVALTYDFIMQVCWLKHIQVAYKLSEEFAKLYFHKYWTEIHDVTTIWKRNVCRFIVTLNAFDLSPTCDTADVQAILPFPPNPLKIILCAVSHVGSISNAFKVTMKLQTFLFQMVVTSCISVQYLWKYPPDGATFRGGPWPPLQYASRSLGSLLYLSIRLYPSSSGPWTRHPAISFLVFLLVAYSFPYNIFFGIAVSCILSICPSHLILWHLINLSMFSPLIMASNSLFRRILHNSFSFTGPYIFRKIFLSNIANALSSSVVSGSEICFFEIVYRNHIQYEHKQ